MKKYLSAFLVLMLAMVLCVPAFAAEPDQNAIKVTLPTALTVTDNRDGTYQTSAAGIINQGEANIVVSGITAEPADGWSLVSWDSLAEHAIVNSRYTSLAFYGRGIAEDGTVTGAELPAIPSSQAADLEYDFWMSPQTAPLEGVQVASAVVTIGLDGNGGLAGIEVTKRPDKTEYAPGETFDPAGMTVIARYHDGTTADVTDLVEITDGENLADGQTSVTVRYTEGTKQAAAPVEISIFAIAVTNYSTAYISYTEPDGGWRSGENTFTVTCTGAGAYMDTGSADVGLIRDGRVTELRGEAVSDSTYSFTADLRSGDEIALAVNGDVDLNGRVNGTDSTRLSQGLRGVYALDGMKQLTADINNSGNIGYTDTLLSSDMASKVYTSPWGQTFDVPVMAQSDVSGFSVASPSGASAMAPFDRHTTSGGFLPVADAQYVFLDGWTVGENAFTVTRAEPFSVYRVRCANGSGEPLKDGEVTALTGTDLGNDTYSYTVDLQDNDYIYINDSVAPLDIFIDVTVTDYTGGKATFAAPSEGWVKGLNTFSVTCGKPCVVATIRDGSVTELAGHLDGSVFTVQADMKRGDEIAVALLGDADLNGRTNLTDMTRLFQSLVGGYTLPQGDFSRLVCDINRDGVVDETDVTLSSKALANVYTTTWNETDRPFVPEIEVKTGAAAVIEFLDAADIRTGVEGQVVRLSVGFTGMDGFGNTRLTLDMQTSGLTDYTTRKRDWPVAGDNVDAQFMSDENWGMTPALFTVSSDGYSGTDDLFYWTLTLDPSIPAGYYDVVMNVINLTDKNFAYYVLASKPSTYLTATATLVVRNADGSLPDAAPATVPADPAEQAAPNTDAAVTGPAVTDPAVADHEVAAPTVTDPAEAPVDAYAISADVTPLVDGTLAGNISELPAEAGAGETVQFTLVPAEGFKLSDKTGGITVTGAGGTEVSVSPVSGKAGAYAFTMPAEGVTVTVSSGMFEADVTEDPAADPAESTTEVPTEGPVDDPAGAPAEEPAEEPIEIPVEEPAEEPIEGHQATSDVIVPDNGAASVVAPVADKVPSGKDGDSDGNSGAEPETAPENGENV